MYRKNFDIKNKNEVKVSTLKMKLRAKICI